jgi:hypothetical protein
VQLRRRDDYLLVQLRRRDDYLLVQLRQWPLESQLGVFLPL